ncbi:MAG: Nif3-like dinuclear metal center hexameric protein [Clostridiales bacterium]|jgi:dinuclear metal center YbgI/SA1388 family protein|nr:Nif3-like dinuclear metal center hexameric protein [Clostridiales bacterium]
MTLSCIIEKIERWAPPSDAENWDNTGLLIGDANREIRRVLVALDATPAVIDEAVTGGFDLLITHHPMIFDPLKRILESDSLGRKILLLIKNNINLYCAHTNLDSADGGVNDVFFDLIGLTEKQPLMEPLPSGNSLGRVGMLPQAAALKDFASEIKNKLLIEEIRYAGPPEKLVQKIGFCVGDASGRRYIQAAAERGCDVYITGDLRYHGTEDALEAGLCLIDITHYAGEAPIIQTVVDFLKKETAREGGSLTIRASSVNGQVFKKL